MIPDLKPYSSYRDSGVPWLGKVPKQWEVLPHRAVFKEMNKRDLPQEDMLSVTINRGVIKQSDLLSDSTKKDASNEDKSKYKLVCPDDLTYNKMRAWQGAVGVSKYRGIVSPAYIVMRPRRLQVPRYFHYLYRTPMFAKEAECWSYGITSDMWSLRSEHFKMIYTCIPSIAEQAAIVRYLDYMDRNIRKYIRAKQKLIKLLEEQKQAIIHQAVTRGLNPDVPMKHSGVEWLGDVPACWSLKRFKFVTRITSGQIDPRIAPYRDYILIAPNHIEKGTGRILDEQTADAQGADSGKYMVSSGQLIYSKIRPNLQKIAIADKDCLCSADMYPISVKHTELSIEYLLYLMLSPTFTKHVVDCSMRVAMPKVNREALGNSWLWYPDLGEQKRTVEYIQKSTSSIKSNIDFMKRDINLLREYRTRLVADVVTGKVDVRDIAARLPDVNESDILEEAVLDDELVITDEAKLSGEDSNAEC
jgi:type I restriction enzyme, S subunit